jgi:F-type H+-transporting ATPase subunit delta
MTNKILTTKIAAPYATALLNLAVETESVDYVTEDINILLNIFDSNKELRDYLKNPLYTKNSKRVILERIFTPRIIIGFPNNRTTVKFLMVLVERSRIDMFQAIAEKYLQLVYTLAEVKIAEVTSAFTLTMEQEGEIFEQIKKRTGARDIKLVKVVDKSLLGGLQIKIGSNVIDISLKGQLQLLAARLETTLF